MRAEMARIRSQGWVLSEQQLKLGFRGVAVPLRDRHGNVVAALNVTMPTGNEPGEDAVARVLSVLTEAAQAMRNLILFATFLVAARARMDWFPRIFRH